MIKHLLAFGPSVILAFALVPSATAADDSLHYSETKPEATISYAKLLSLAADPAAGIWKLDRAKTKANGPASSAINIDLVTIEGTDNGLTYSWSSRGKAVRGEFTAKYDGKDYPVQTDPDADTVSLRRIDANTIDFVFKKNGKVVMRERNLVSKDRKTSIVTYTDAKGQDRTGVTIWNRQ